MLGHKLKYGSRYVVFHSNIHFRVHIELKKQMKSSSVRNKSRRKAQNKTHVYKRACMLADIQMRLLGSYHNSRRRKTRKRTICKHCNFLYDLWLYEYLIGVVSTWHLKTPLRYCSSSPGSSVQKYASGWCIHCTWAFSRFSLYVEKTVIGTRWRVELYYIYN